MPNCTFVVPTKVAENDLPNAKKISIGHLSIDKALQHSVAANISATKALLQINNEEKLVFISGTSQPHHVDVTFVKTILAELATGNHPNMQCRFAVHPGVAATEIYVLTLLEACAKYPTVANQFKIIISEPVKSKLKNPLPDSPFVLDADVNGPVGAAAADFVAQAVPGALLIESALRGLPTYTQGTSYLGTQRKFAENLAGFFAGTKTSAFVSRKELGLEEVDAPTQLAKLF